MDDVELRRRIVGTWKLAFVVYEGQATKERTPVLRRASERRPDRNARGTLARCL